MPRTFVVIPTYNEKENIMRVVDAINGLGMKNLEIIVVDDNSPDRTWKIIETNKSIIPNLHLLRRFGARGRGAAVRAGMKEALKMGAEAIVEMDADFSHDPESIRFFLRALKDSDAVIGSRFAEGGRLMRKSPSRNFITKCAVKYLRTILGYKLTDPTSGYRCFKRRTLEKIKLETMKAEDYFGVTEILYRCHRMGLKISEIPITFKDRTGGSSKLSCRQLLKYLIRTVKLKFSRF